MNKIVEDNQIVNSKEYKMFIDEVESKIAEYIYKTINNDLSYSSWAHELTQEEFSLLEDITYDNILKRIDKW
tara:strand:- start:191 stop:406 length:216 start_codon:yes stop_codon:yes gene_type:complete